MWPAWRCAPRHGHIWMDEIHVDPSSLPCSSPFYVVVAPLAVSCALGNIDLFVLSASIWLFIFIRAFLFCID